LVYCQNCLTIEIKPEWRAYFPLTYWLEVLLWLVITGFGIFAIKKAIDWSDRSIDSLPMPLAAVVVVGAFLLVIALQHHFV